LLAHSQQAALLAHSKQLQLRLASFHLHSSWVSRSSNSSPPLLAALRQASS
jgi:hypothetical protein